MRLLIRVRNGLEAPAPGRWAIAPGQPVSCTPGRWWRRQGATERTVAGGLLLDESGPASFRLSLTAVALNPVTMLTYQSFSIDRGSPDGPWFVNGEALWAGRTTPARSLLTYHGVFRTGTGAVAWMGWRTRLSLGIAGTGRRPTKLRLSAELNLDAPAVLLDDPAGRRRTAEW